MNLLDYVRGHNGTIKAPHCVHRPIMPGGPKCPRTFWDDKTGFKKYQSPNVFEIYRKMLLFDADLRTKKSLKHEISSHKNKDKSSHPGSVLTTQTWAPSQEIEQFYLGTSLTANGNLGCTVRTGVRGATTAWKHLNRKSQDCLWRKGASNSRRTLWDAVHWCHPITVLKCPRTLWAAGHYRTADIMGRFYRPIMSADIMGRSVTLGPNIRL